jgi:hypothetical protein
LAADERLDDGQVQKSAKQRAMTYIAAHAIGLVLLLLLFEATGLLLVRTERGADAVDRTGLVPIALGIGTWMYGLFALASLALLVRGSGSISAVKSGWVRGRAGVGAVW